MYYNIGGLLTGFKWYDFKHVKIRNILVQDLSAIDRSRKQKRVVDLIPLLEELTNLTYDQLLTLTIGDAVYIMAYLRKACYTESHLTLTWDCSAEAVKDSRGIVYPEHIGMNKRDLIINKFVRGTCDTKNTNLVYSYQYTFSPIQPKWSEVAMVKNCHVPTLHDLHLLEEWEDDDLKSFTKYKKFFKQLLCLDGSTIEEKLENLKCAFEDRSLNAVGKFHDDTYHGIELTYTLNCNSCGHRPVVKQVLTPHDVLPVIGESSVMNMQYNLMQAMHTSIGEDTPVKKLLYWHSTHQKHEQERAQKREAIRKRTRR